MLILKFPEDNKFPLEIDFAPVPWSDKITAEEINVKQVAIGNAGLALDTILTPELREEGQVREIIRSIQQYRKEQGMKPGEPGTYTVASDRNRQIIEKYRAQIEKTTNMTLTFE